MENIEMLEKHAENLRAKIEIKEADVCRYSELIKKYSQTDTTPAIVLTATKQRESKRGEIRGLFYALNEVENLIEDSL